MLALETVGLSKEFSRGKVRALNNVSLTVEAGQIFGLLGPNGAGKTTLIKIVLGILNPTTGSARLLEKPINDIGVKEKLGYLPENHRYPDFLKGAEILEYFAGLAGLRGKQISETKERLLKLVNMEKWQGTKIKKYSKGMMQRLGLAQAMINDPDILFLDEPTDGVDPIGRKDIRTILNQLKDEGKTIFLNSHLLSEVEMVCDQVAILDKGKLVRAGTIDELTSTSKTYRFQISETTKEVIEGLHKFSLNIHREKNSIQVTCTDQENLNGIIDYLRANHVDIKSIVPHRQSLEESFIEILKKDIQ